jgi:hypothetical protein
MAMSRIDDGDAAAEIDEATAFDVPQFRVLGARDNDGRACADATRDNFVASCNPSLIEAFRSFDVHDRSPDQRRKYGA